MISTADLSVSSPPFNVRKDRNDHHFENRMFRSSGLKDMAKALECVIMPRKHECVFRATLKLSSSRWIWH